jgi:hypothetical protein
MTVVSILAAVTLALGVAGQGMTLSEIYDIESDESYSAAADKLLREKEADIKEERTEARSEGDAVAEAEADLLLATLRVVKKNANIQSVKRQQRQRKAAFLEEGWNQFEVDMLLRGLSAGASRIGFGKLQDTYVRGTNWPPDPSKSVALFDPKARRAVRIMLENDRPVLDVIKFSDDLKDVLNVVLGGFNVLKSSTSGGQAQTGEEAYGVVTEGLERLDDLEPLPDTIGAFISVSLIKEILVDNPQIAGLSEEEQAGFVIDQACKQLRELVEAEPDVDRSDALRAAQRLLECPGAVDAPGAEDPEDDEPPAEEDPEEDESPAEEDSEEEEPPVEVPEGDVTPIPDMVFEGTYTLPEHDGEGVILFHVYETGDVTMGFRDPDYGDFCPWKWMEGTYENGTFEFLSPLDGEVDLSGTFDEETVSGSGPMWGEEPNFFQFSGSRVR